VAPTVTKRPHFVPQTYLRAWAGPDGRVAYRRRDAPAAILNSTGNVAVKSGIYGKGQLGQAREDAFNELEKVWADLRDELITQGDLHGDRRSQLAVYMAHQLTRTLKHSNQVNFMSDVAASITEWPITEDAIGAYLRKLDGTKPEDAEIYAAWTFVTGAPAGTLTRDDTLKISMEIAVKEIAPRLEARDWTVRKFRQPALMTNDCPVHPWRRPAKNLHPGGVGIETADEVRFPLSRGALLVMTRPGEAATNASTRSVNAEICAQCHQFVVASPKDKPALDNVALRKRPPRLRFRLGEGYTVGLNGADEYLGEVLHTYVD
jgi:cytochrome c553